MTKKIDGAVLKNTAVIAMIIDHIAKVLPVSNEIVYSVFVSIGRIAFPLFAFLVSEGIYYTKGKIEYLIRLGGWASISMIPFKLAFGLGYGNVLFTLLLGAASVILTERYTLIVKVTAVIIATAAAVIFKTDYCAVGPLLIAVFYYLRNDRVKQIELGIPVLFIGYLISYEIVKPGTDFVTVLETELPALAAFILIYFYNGEKGKQLPKYFYYALYPLHLIVLVLIREYVMV